MVCVPCFIIPVLLYIWHKFLQPIFLPILQRYWNPWEKKDADGKVIKTGPEFPFECKGGSCPYTSSSNKNKSDKSADIGGNDTNQKLEKTAVTADGSQSDLKKNI